MALTLGVSVRNLGGQLSSSPLRVYFGSGPRDSERRQLERLGAAVILTGPLPRAAAKARILQDHAERGAGTLVALDAGVVVLGDLATEAHPDALRGLPLHSSPLSEEQWQAWLEFKRLPPSCFGPPTSGSPTSGFAASGPGGWAGVPYLSTSVLIIPKNLCNDLAVSWAAHAQTFTEAFSAPTWSGPRLPEQARTFIDELALTCAVLETGTPIDPLHPGCNFRPTREQLEISGIGQVRALKAVDCRGVLSPDGFIERTHFLPVNPDLERLNRMTAAHLGVPYHPRKRNRHAEINQAAAKASTTLRRYASTAARKAAPWLPSGRRRANGGPGELRRAP
jgi:hypothetical protein